MAVPFNRGARRGISRGGPAPTYVRRTLVAAIEGEDARTPGTVNDTMIRRDKTAWYPTDRYSPAGNGWVNWTEAGPIRPELHMRDVTLRTMAGTSNSRNLQAPIPGDVTYAPGYIVGPDGFGVDAPNSKAGGLAQPGTRMRPGLHTDPRKSALINLQRQANGQPRMRKGRQDRLLSGQYTGQSFSATTRTQR